MCRTPGGRPNTQIVCLLVTILRAVLLLLIFDRRQFQNIEYLFRSCTDKRINAPVLTGAVQWIVCEIAYVYTLVLYDNIDALIQHEPVQLELS